MQILNLKSGFEPLGIGSFFLEKSFLFPGGEVGVKVSGGSEDEVTITTRIQNSNDVMELLMVTDAVRRMSTNRSKKIHLLLPYLPYARQDRVVNGGEAHSLYVFTEMLKLQKYESIIVFDAHSEVSGALMTSQNFVAVPNYSFVKKVFEGKADFVLISPDAGAAKKIRGVASAINYQGKPVQALKYRLTNGNIDEIEIFEADLSRKDAYIVDDICDGGATFIALAAELRKRNVGKVFLVVSHGIFSKGLEVLKQGGIDHVFTTDSFKSQDISTGFVTEVKLCASILT